MAEKIMTKVAPFRMIGNLYFVGTKEASSHLIDTGDGLILIDTGYQSCADMIVESMSTLGFDIKDVKIILSGVSMGASTVLMASELSLPENVIGIIADCPYSSPVEIIKSVAKHRRFNPKLIYPLVKISAKLFAGFDIDSASPVQAVKNTNIPVLIVHGDEDKFVPYHMGRKIFEACASENKRFLTGKGADHALSYFCDVKGYTDAVGEFISSIT